jgi:hypothetical protein
MQFNLNRALELLEKTPGVIESLLDGLSEEWTTTNEGGDSWSPYDIVGHLIHGEKTDWMPRMEIILSSNVDKVFEPFDRFAQFNDSNGKTMRQLLSEFKLLRASNTNQLRLKGLVAEDLQQAGIHPALGQVTLQQLLAAWVVHDLNHIAQITRIMAKQYKTEVGPWEEYLRILSV